MSVTGTQGNTPGPNDKVDIYPTTAKALNVTSVDADLTAIFARGYARRIRVGTAGNLNVVMIDDTGSTTSAVLIPNCIQGENIDGFFTRVMNSGTTASNLTAFA